MIDAQWSPARPLIVACISSDKSLYIYDLNMSHYKPCFMTTIEENNQKISLTAIKFSKNGQNLLCLDSNGKIHFFTLAQEFLQCKAGEHAVLEKLATIY